MADLIDLRGLRLVRQGPDGVFDVLRDVDLSLAEGERLALLGGNGSGKSSLLRYLATPGVLSGIKVGLMFQDPEEQLIASTVAEEVQLGRPELAVGPILEDIGLDGRADQDPCLLSAGQKQRLQLAVVLSGAPDLLLLDEPTSLQDPQQMAWLMSCLDAWPGAMIWATQRPCEAALCQKVLALHGGRPIAMGQTGAVLPKPEIAALLQPDYASVSLPPPVLPRLFEPSRPSMLDGMPVAELAGVGCTFLDGGGFSGIDLTMRPGDCVGIAGPNGCGKSTLLAVLAGLRRPDTGTARLGKRTLYRRGARDLDHGLAALAPQFPEYLFCCGDVAAEIRLDPGMRGADPAVVLAAVDLPVSLLRHSPHALSGGQKRRLALSLALCSGRPLILLDEPTAALDAAGRAMVARLVRTAAPQAALVIASHDIGFLEACGCKVLRLGPTGCS